VNTRASLTASFLPAGALLAWILTYLFAFSPPPGQPSLPALYVLYGVPYVAFAAVGGLIIRAQRASRVGWVMAGIGIGQSLATLADESLRTLARTPAGHSPAGWLVVLVAPLPIASTALILVLLLVFPDGHLPSPRWRWFLAVSGVLVLAVLVQKVVSVYPSAEIPGLPPNPMAVPALADALAPFTPFWTFPIAVLIAAASLVVRYRAAGVVVRLQIKWFALAAVVLAVCEAGNVALGNAALAGVLDVAGKLAVVAAVGIAVLRHRLYDVDLAISRALTYGWLAVLVTAIYVGLVVGVGSVVGSPAGPDLLLSLVATIVVALVSLPLRSRLQELANRLVYGRRQAPYESLAGFTRRLADRYAIGDVLPEVAAALGEGLRATAAAVRLGKDGAGPPAAVWPPAGALPDAPPDGCAPISHQGTVLGTLSVWSGASLTGSEQRLLSDLGTQAGLVVHNAALTVELQDSVRELRASRLRLVAAQDAERRRFERDLHDGAQQDLITLRMKLGTAERLLDTSEPGARALLDEIREHTAATLESMRRLSRGLYPPLLQSHGLVPALVAHARRLPLATEVHGPDLRFPADVETAVYFCCVEALQNAVKHAAAGRARVSVEDAGSGLRFEVLDDGCGFDVGSRGGGSGMLNMTDRVAALGGRLVVRSGPGGTRVSGTVPLPRTPSADPGAAQSLKWAGPGADLDCNDRC
jgi:signal transduction histidine kinase